MEIAVTVGRGEMLVGVALLHERAHLFGPGIVAEQAVFVGQVPHDVGERREAGNGITVIALLIRAAHAGLAKRIHARTQAVT